MDSPTSHKMKTSFILKHSNKSFDIYFNEMKRRNQAKGLVTAANGITHKAGHGAQLASSFVRTNGPGAGPIEIRGAPAARDGHSSFVHGDHFFVFGGDRHHMPFNDLYLMKIE